MFEERTTNELFLTTVDNPYDPVEQYEEWRTFDWEKGYYTESYISRVVQSLEENNLDSNIKEDIYEHAMKEIVKVNSSLYKLIHCDVKEHFIKIDSIEEE